MKKIFLFLVALNLFSNAFSQVRSGVLKGMTAVPFACMLDNEDYDFEFYDSIKPLCQDLLSGNIQAAVLPSFSAEGVVEKSGGTLLVSYVTSTTNFKLIGRRTNTTFSVLPGKKIGIAGHGIAEKLFLFLLKKNGIPIEKGDAGVDIVYYETEAQAVNDYLNNKISYVVTSEPATTSLCRRGQKNYIAMDLQEQYRNFYPERRIPLSVLVMRTDFLESDYAEVSRFTDAVEESVRQAIIHPAKVSSIIQEKNLGISQNTSREAIKYSNFCFKSVTGDFHLIVNP